MTSPDENLLGSFVTFFDHGLLMIEDSESTAAHDGWDAATEYVHFDQDSLYIAVQSVVDGAVAVAAYRDGAPASEIEGLIEAFSGTVDSKFGRLSGQNRKFFGGEIGAPPAPLPSWGPGQRAAPAGYPLVTDPRRTSGADH